MSKAADDLYLTGFEAAIDNAKRVGQSFFIWNHKLVSSIEDKINSDGLSVYKWGSIMDMPHEYPYIIGNVS